MFGAQFLNWVLKFIGFVSNFWLLFLAGSFLLSSEWLLQRAKFSQALLAFSKSAKKAFSCPKRLTIGFCLIQADAWKSNRRRCRLDYSDRRKKAKGAFEQSFPLAWRHYAFWIQTENQNEFYWAGTAFGSVFGSAALGSVFGSAWAFCDLAWASAAALSIEAWGTLETSSEFSWEGLT